MKEFYRLETADGISSELKPTTERRPRITTVLRWPLRGVSWEAEASAEEFALSTEYREYEHYETVLVHRYREVR